MSIEVLLDRLDLSNCIALEFFGGKGEWQGKYIASRVKEMHSWEYSKENEKYLKNNLPNAKIRIGDSYILSNELQYRNKFDLINFDNTPGIFGENYKHTEHIDALFEFDKLIKDDGIIIFNLLLDPIKYLLYFGNIHIAWNNCGSILLRIKRKAFLEWFNRRKIFYGRNKIDIKLATETYKKFFESRDFKIIDSMYLYRNKYVISMLFKIQRIHSI